MTPDELFLRSVAELARVVVQQPGDEYQMLSASAVLRRLLLDGDPLLHQVNRIRRHKIKFVAGSESTPLVQSILEDHPRFWAWLDGISPVLGPPNTVSESLTLDQFLKKRAMIIGAHDISVKDLILQIANVEGGVHAPGTPKTDIETALRETSEAVRIGGVPAATSTLRGIAAVALDAVIPLADEIKAG